MVEKVETTASIHRNCANILAIHYRMVGFHHLPYTYNFESNHEIMKEISRLSSKKPIQQSNLPTKIVEKNIDITSCFLHHTFNKLLSASTLSPANIYVDVTPVHKKGRKSRYRKLSFDKQSSKSEEIIEITHVQSVCQNLQRIFRSIDVICAKALMPSIIS